MWKGIYGIFSNVSYSNFTFRPITKKQGLKRKRLTIQLELIGVFKFKKERDNA